MVWSIKCKYTLIFPPVRLCGHATYLTSLTFPSEWVSGDIAAVAQWDSGTTGDISYHKVWKQTQQVFTEVNDRAEWGNIVGR